MVSKSSFARMCLSASLYPIVQSTADAPTAVGLVATTLTTTPMRGIAYGALPCKQHDCEDTGRVSEDIVQEAYSKEWGPDGRDDLRTIATLGGNTVRLYHSFGLDIKHDHGGFLDHAQEMGLNVMPGYHTQGGCPKFDCYDTWRLATLEGFKYGFKVGEGWHPAVSALVILNEPDFFGSWPECQPRGAWCRVKAVLSALDGVLAAEREAGVAAGHVRLSVTWSFGMMPSIDGLEGGPGLFGFQDTVAGVANPALAKYKPRCSQTDLEHAFKTRWLHGVNTQAPWGFVKAVIANNYAKFAPIPWFIGEYGANGQLASTIQADLEDMQKLAEQPGSGFMGAAMFQFQTAHFKGGSELNFGLFRLGDEKLWEISPPCDIGLPKCPTTWPVYCLNPELSWLPGSMGHRAQAVADAWKGSMKDVVAGPGFCQDARQRRLGAGSRLLV